MEVGVSGVIGLTVPHLSVPMLTSLVTEHATIPSQPMEVETVKEI